jgi:DNA-binding response OmpR family regulator
LRQKIEENPEKPRYIINQRGYGYQFVAEPLSRSQPIKP